MFNLYLTTDNAVFEDRPIDEIVRLLRKVADVIELGVNLEMAPVDAKILDVNGNTVGNWKLEI